MKNQFVKKIIAVMLAGALILGETGTWTASAAEISEETAESVESAAAETSVEETVSSESAADVTVESTETSDDESADAEASEDTTTGSGTGSEENTAGSDAESADDTSGTEAASADDTDEDEDQTQTDGNSQDTAEEAADPEIYTELMAYIDATSALLAEYPCDYDGTLDIDIDSGEITDQNGETVDAMDDAIEAAVDSDDADAAAETLEENGYVVLDVDDTTVSVEDPYQTMRLIVTSEEGLSSSYGAEAVISYENEYILQYSSTEDTINAYTALAADAEVDELYIDAVVTAYETEEEEEEISSYALTNSDGEDTHLSWGVETMGLDVMQENLEATDTDESTEDDLEEVVVAVVDSGVNYDNIYLDGRILSEDGYDCYNEDDDAMDDYGHGTHVAGIVVDGTSDNVMVLPVKVIGSDGNGTVTSVKNGIRYALDYGVDVINLSLGMDDSAGTASYFETLFEEALDNGCLVVCAAGNSSTDVAYCYPANSELTLAISALDTSLSLADYSNYGDGIDFSAPGTGIKSAYYTSSTSTATMKGTSMATPHVTAAIALLKTWDNTLSNDEIEELLEDYSVDLGDEGKDSSYGYGYIYLGDFDVDQKKSPKLTAEAESYSLVVGDSEELKVSYKGDGDISYTSADDSIATVSEEGVVTAIGEGTVTITVTVAETDNYASAFVSLEFVVGIIQLSECTITLSQTEYTYDGTGHEPAVTVKYENVTLTEDSDYEVAYSDNVEAGTATVTVKGEKNCDGTVEKSFTINKAEQTVTVTAGSTSIKVGKTTSLTANTTGDGAISYTSSDTSVAKVSSSGEVTGVGAGTATITATAAATTNYSEASATVTITVSKNSQTVTVTAGSTSVKAGKTTTVTGTTTGDGAISYKSSDTSIAKVDSSTGKVTGVGVGTVTITTTAAATTTYSKASATVKIKVGLSTPSISSVTNTTSGVKIKWGKVTGASGYYIYRKTGSSGSYEKIATIKSGSTVSYTNSCSSGTYKVSSGKTYYYKVVAYSGSTSSSKSSAMKIRYLTAGKISSLKNTSSGITVKWTKVSGATGYYVYRKTASGSYKRIKTITKNSTVSYTDTAVKNKNGTTYIYCVRPYYENSAGTITKGSYTGKTTVRLKATTLSSVKSSSSKKMTVKWSKKSSVTGYQIQYSRSSSFSSGNKTVTVAGSSKKSKTISGLTKGKTYYVRIRTYKTVNGKKYYSAWSAKKKVKIS